VPTVGWSIYPLAPFCFLINGHDIIGAGYSKFCRKPGLFKSLIFGRGWQVYICEPRLLEELRKAPGRSMSFVASQHEAMQADYTMDLSLTAGWQWHVSVAKNQFSQQLPKLFPYILDELEAAFEDIVLPKSERSPRILTLREPLGRIIARISQRAIVGLPLCQDAEYLDLIAELPYLTTQSGLWLSLFPKAWRPYALKCLGQAQKKKKRVVELLLPQVEERLNEFNKQGKELREAPNDAITWLLEEAGSSQQVTPQDITSRLLFFGFAAKHNISVPFSMAMIHLAAFPEYLNPLRSEAEAMLDPILTNWTVESLSSCRRIGSFIKETLRLYSANGTSLNRRVLQDFTFSNGITLPRGTYIACPAESLHRDALLCGPGSETFDGFRYAGKKTTGCDSEPPSPGEFVPVEATSPTFLSFGHGKFACPGRHFSSVMLQLVFTYALLNFDVVFPDGVDGKDAATRTAAWRFNGEHRLPRSTAALVFKRR